MTFEFVRFDRASALPERGPLARQGDVDTLLRDAVVNELEGGHLEDVASRVT